MRMDFADVAAAPPAAFGRLCVEMSTMTTEPSGTTPAAFGRLCVEIGVELASESSHHPAAFGRLCVEILALPRVGGWLRQPPSGGCVLKLAPDSFSLPAAWSSRLRAAVC